MREDRRPLINFCLQDGSFSHQISSNKTIQNSSSKKSRFGVVLTSFWEASGGHFSSFFAPGSLLDTDLLRKRRFPGNNTTPIEKIISSVTLTKRKGN